MKLETSKGYKLTQTPFLRKILFLQILAIFGHFWLKNRLSGILLNIGTLDFFLIFCMKLEIIKVCKLTLFLRKVLFCWFWPLSFFGGDNYFFVNFSIFNFVFNFFHLFHFFFFWLVLYLIQFFSKFSLDSFFYFFLFKVHWFTLVLPCFSLKVKYKSCHFFNKPISLYLV